MQAGLLKVVPQAVLDLLTWQEVEKKVCGDPEITVEALKRLSECPAFTIKHTFHTYRLRMKLLFCRCLIVCLHLPFLSAHYEDLEQSDSRVQYLWEALTNFTNGQFTFHRASFSLQRKSFTTLQ